MWIMAKVPCWYPAIYKHTYADNAERESWESDFVSDVTFIFIEWVQFDSFLNYFQCGLYRVADPNLPQENQQEMYYTWIELDWTILKCICNKMGYNLWWNTMGQHWGYYRHKRIHVNCVVEAIIWFATTENIPDVKIGWKSGKIWGQHVSPYTEQTTSIYTRLAYLDSDWNISKACKGSSLASHNGRMASLTLHQDLAGKLAYYT